MAATEAIQRALRGDLAAAEIASTSEDSVIDGFCRPIKDDPAIGAMRAEDTNTQSPLTAQPRVDPVAESSRFIARSYITGAGHREYKLYTPALYRGQALPLVVMLHGCKQNPDDFAAATRMNALAEELGFLVIYPRQPGNANVSNCWNWFEAKHQQRDSGEPSLIAGITREVIAEYGLDAQRVYVAGLSAGGAMSAIMGTIYPDLYAAVGIHSGLAYAAAQDMPSAFAAMRGDGPKHAQHKPRGKTVVRSVPTIVFHGDHDTTVHPSNGDALIEQACVASRGSRSRENASAAHVMSVEHGDVSGLAYTRTIYRGVSDKPVMEHWLVHGAAHAWSGGSTEGSFSNPRGPDASREMLRFFFQHRIT